MKIIFNLVFLVSLLIFKSALFANDWSYESFESNPFLSDWRVHGDESLFFWDEESESLKVTWDSEKPNSYFYRPLGRTLTEADSFAFTFQITLEKVKAGYLDGQPYTFEVAVGLSNMAAANDENFNRGTGTDSPHLVEWDYFPDTGFGATISPAMSSGKSQFSAGFTFPAELLIGKSYSVRLSFNALSKTLTTDIMEDGKLWKKITGVKLSSDFSGFQVDAFNVSSYSAKGSESSLLVVGRLDDFAISMGSSFSDFFDVKIIDGQLCSKAFLVNPDKWQVESSSDLLHWNKSNAVFVPDGFFYQFMTPVTKNQNKFYRLIQ